MYLFDLHHQIHLLNLDNKWPLPPQIMPPHNDTKTASSSSNRHPTIPTPTPFTSTHPPTRKSPRAISPTSDDNLSALPPNLASLTLSSSAQNRTIILGLINFPPTAISVITNLANTSFPSIIDGKSSYIKLESKTIAWVVIKIGMRATLYSKKKFAEFTRQWVGFLCGGFKELWYHGWGFVTVVQNPLEPPTVGRKVLAQKQNVDVQNMVFRFDGTREQERYEWLGMSLHQLGEVLVVGGLPARVHKRIAKSFFPMGLGKRKWGVKGKYKGYQRLSFAGRKYLGPKGAEDKTVVRLVEVVEEEGWELYASLGTWPGLVLFRKARAPGSRVPSRSLGSEERVVAMPEVD
ncbi:uncharacterized protein QC761_123455 [Podospora bellae-mahoneyi]|uniref:Uncharacterized protein n=1 Tax=Podospora bellae-mahoneyi TaxID=2093777 RepID=A0ABR0FTD2_9PEZI|nr:hypothetical protein QC761_123455 [Podospora bellae-mahoneyi]